MNKVLKYPNMHLKTLKFQPFTINIPISFLCFLISYS